MKSDIKSNNAMVKDNKTKNFKIVKKKLKSKKSNARSTSPISELVKNGVKTGLVKKNNAKKQLRKKVEAKKNNEISTSPISEMVKISAKTNLAKKSNTKTQLQKKLKAKKSNERSTSPVSEMTEKIIMTKSIPKRKHQNSPKTKNVNKERKTISLFVMDPESPQKFECFKRNVENAITTLNNTSHKLKDLKKFNNIIQKIFV